SGRASRGGVVAVIRSQMASLAVGLSAKRPLYGARRPALNRLVRSRQDKHEDLPFSLLLLNTEWESTEMSGVRAQLSDEESAAGVVAAVQDDAGVNGSRFVDCWNQPLTS
ncbi:short-chain dehydrogenase, partial [Pseudomonas aeruginosa]